MFFLRNVAFKNHNLAKKRDLCLFLQKPFNCFSITTQVIIRVTTFPFMLFVSYSETVRNDAQQAF